MSYPYSGHIFPSRHARLRLARPTDARHLSGMSRDYIESGLGWYWTPQRIDAQICRGDSVVLVAESDHVIAGFAVMHFGEFKGHLTLFAVAPEYRRRGIGRQMMSWLEKSACTAGLSHLDLEVRQTNTSGQAFYQRLGYVPRGVKPGYYRGEEHAVRMRRVLGRSRASLPVVLPDVMALLRRSW